jgi:hypothetical protein
VPERRSKPRFANQQFGEVATVIFQRVGQLAQANPAGRHAHLCPGWLCGACRCHRLGRFAGAGQRHAVHRFASGWVDTSKKSSVTVRKA